MFCGAILLLHRTLSSGSIEVSYRLLGIAHHCKTGPAMAGPAGVGATALLKGTARKTIHPSSFINTKSACFDRFHGEDHAFVTPLFPFLVRGGDSAAAVFLLFLPRGIHLTEKRSKDNN